MSRPMIIGIDIRDLRSARTGTKTYLEELCRQFSQLETPGCRFCFLDSSLPQGGGTTAVSKYSGHFFYQLWKQLVLPLKAWKNHCDIVFCTDNVVPLLRLGYQTVPVFHDAFFFENPEHYGKLWLKLYQLTAMPAARRAAFVVTPTRYAQGRLHHYTGIPLQQLKVVYEGPKTLEEPEIQDRQLPFGLVEKGYVLHVGSFFKRKNIPALVHAFGELKLQTGSTLKLVLAGPHSASGDSNDLKAVEEAIRDTGLQDQVILTGYLSDSGLAAIYAGALMYVFPSVNEGFGIPVLEAFRYSLPVLVADNTCLPEVGGDAVLTFNPFDPKDMCAKMRQVIEDAGIRQELISKGKNRLHHFSWRKAALELVALFRQTLQRN